eukprot:m.27526 g.27526  ORF g.27526 m.27526 type:complete len:119 (-) comp6442_c0_seq2:418-774(-)
MSRGHGRQEPTTSILGQRTIPQCQYFSGQSNLCLLGSDSAMSTFCNECTPYFHFNQGTSLLFPWLKEGRSCVIVVAALEVIAAKQSGLRSIDKGLRKSYPSSLADAAFKTNDSSFEHG